MVPGYLRGTYDEREISFFLPAFAERAGGEFIQGRAIGVDTASQVVQLESGGEVGYDLASFNLGSRLIGDDEASVARNATLVKPMSRAVSLRGKMKELAKSNQGSTRRVAIVGGGSAGVEVACSIAAVLDDSGGRRQVTILEASSEILSKYSERFRRRTEKALQEKEIEVRLGNRVAAVHEDSVELTGGSRVGSDLTVWLTGPAAQPLFRDSGLAVDDRGFLLVNDALQSLSDRKVFGVGDCATLTDYRDTPKAGVYAVRQAPVLWKSLLATVEESSLPRYEPQRGFLSLLNTGDGKALIRYKGFVGHSRWAWHLKDWIDRRFMTRYQSLTPSNNGS
jgi:NADH dehydrogenase FAD-containing subunit